MTPTAPILSRSFLLSALFVLLCTASTFAADPEAPAPPGTIAFLPFTIHAPGDLSYLRDGIGAMLASRLAADTGVTVIERDLVDQALQGLPENMPTAELQQLGQKLQADYLVQGSITGLGESLSLDAKVIVVAGGKSESFYANAAKQDDVILAIDQLASGMAEKLFGRARPAATATAASSSPVPAVAPIGAGVPYQTSHPDRMLFEKGGSGGQGSAFITPGGITSPRGFTKSQNFAMALQSMDIGDVDGDGQEEIVLAGRNEVVIYRRVENQLKQIGRIPINARCKVHYVTLADLNKNGRMEIYVSAADDKSPNSLAVEWQGQEFSFLFKDLDWYVRAFEIPGEGMILAGQRSGTSGPIQGGVYRLTVVNGKAKKEGEIQLPRKVYLFDFVLADLDGNGKNEVIAIDREDHLRVMRPSGAIMWKSDEFYGGTNRYIGETREGDINNNIRPVDMDDDPHDRVYIPSRIILADVNNDGKAEVVLNKNLSTASRVLENYKSYPSGEIHALTWNGIALSQLWRTRKIDGYISDYQFRPAKDGEVAQLLVGLVLQEGALDFFSSKQSAILTYQLDLSQATSSGNSEQ